ncbi:sporulation protein [Metabacillus iocasae]|uniref:Sporulation-control protein n=1 Tax=Priestia iocasae TaxID=2291674 RepID=A0ABS2QTS7_9BACI|nr:sporulation protein [Metabacillus iocasae]MBM7702879.1 sporulation-control protein [Metabacillus iocasae]
MLKKFLAKLGKGAATVDLQFQPRSYAVGDTIQGEVLLQGGQVDQKINKLSVHFMMKVQAPNGHSAVRQVEVISLTDAWTITTGEKKVIPFTYTIPTTLPLSRGSVSYYFDTQLDIEGGVDRTDVDFIQVTGSQRIQAILDSMNRLGFQEKSTSGKLDTYGQEFEFFPTTSYAQTIREVELRFAEQASGVTVWMEVDCKAGFGEIEAKREFMLSVDMVSTPHRLDAELKQYIEEMMQQPESFKQPFSFKQAHGKSSSMLPGMIGGLAVGVLGGVLLSELMDGFGLDDMMGDATEALGDMEEDFEDSFEFGDFFEED